MNNVIEIISNLGFPVACCCYLIYQYTLTLDYFKKFTGDLNKSLDDNTRAITELISIIKTRGDK